MDDIFTELENELKALRPRRPSADLRARIGRELAGHTPATAPVARTYAAATSFRSWKWAGWQLAAAAAVALAVSFGIWRYPSGRAVESPAVVPVSPATATIAQPSSSAAPSLGQRYRPVGATNILYDMQDEGPVYLADRTPARRMRYRYVDTYTWKAPASNASLKWSVPREEVRVVPASLR